MRRWLILGATGALGGALMAAIAARGERAIGAARAEAGLNFDIADRAALDHALAYAAPHVVVNCAAIVDLAACEREPERALDVHAQPAAALAAWSRASGRPFVQISTDQVLGDGAGPHDESAPTAPVNQYGRSKLLGEHFALESPHALVARTNLTSARLPAAGKPPFAAWALNAIETRAPMTLFDDYVCSTIDVNALAEALIDCVDAGARGVLNLAAREAASKAQFVRALAARLGVDPVWAKTASAASMPTPRRLACALDVSRAEAILARRLPDLAAVTETLTRQWRQTRRNAA